MLNPFASLINKMNKAKKINSQAITNPFAKLSISKEDIPPTKAVQDDSTKFNPSFNLPNKINVPLRQQNSGKSEDTRESEGFKEIRKTKITKIPFEDEIYLPEESAVKGLNKHEKTHFRPRAGKRLFDRHSGTGRGKEIAKNGAGGKTTWGNIDQIAKEETIDYLVQEEYYKNEDECKITLFILDYSSALKKPKLNLEQPKMESVLSKMEEKRRKKTRSFSEERPVEKIERPENGMTYQEYMEKRKGRNGFLESEVPRQIMPNQQNNELDNLATYSKCREQEEYQNWVSSLNYNKRPKLKNKQSDASEEQLNRAISEKLSFSRG